MGVLEGRGEGEGEPWKGGGVWDLWRRRSALASCSGVTVRAWTVQKLLDMYHYPYLT